MEVCERMLGLYSDERYEHAIRRVMNASANRLPEHVRPQPYERERVPFLFPEMSV
jgi:hypothetical protein